MQGEILSRDHTLKKLWTHEGTFLAMKTPVSKAAVDKEWEELKNVPLWHASRVKSKQEVVEQAQKECKTVHFAMLTDLCHLKNSELDKQFQKYSGRVVPRGDVVKDESGSCALFTEQGSSASACVFVFEDNDAMITE